MTSSEKPPQPPQELTKEEQDQLYKTSGLRRVSPEEAKRLGHPTRNELIISPVPRGLAGTRSESEDR